MQTRIFKAPSGASIPFTELGFGSAPIGNLYRALSEAEAQATLQAAWDSGHRYIDTAPLYGLGLSETRLNHFLRDKPRDSYVLSTKIGRLLERVPPDQRTGIGKFFDTPSRREVWDYSYDGVMRSIDFSLERLGLDRVDILFAHDLCVFSQGSLAMRDQRVRELMSGGYKALVKLRDEGVIKAFGAGVNEWEVCEILAKQGDFDLFLLAGRYTLLEQEALESFLPLCEKRGIGIVLGGVYNSGILATGAKPGATYNYDLAPKEILERVAGIEAVCAAHGVSIAEAALQFPFGHPCVQTIIPGTSRPEEVALNIRTMAKKIPAGLWSDLVAKGYIRKDAPLPR
jgi:D-threo-aldose 1-dehydrogenase